MSLYVKGLRRDHQKTFKSDYFWGVFEDFARFRGRIWARLWHGSMRLIDLQVLIPRMPT